MLTPVYPHSAGQDSIGTASERDAQIQKTGVGRRLSPNARLSNLRENLPHLTQGAGRTMQAFLSVPLTMFLRKCYRRLHNYYTGPTLASALTTALAATLREPARARGSTQGNGDPAKLVKGPAQLVGGAGKGAGPEKRIAFKNIYTCCHVCAQWRARSYIVTNRSLVLCARKVRKTPIIHPPDRAGSRKKCGGRGLGASHPCPFPLPCM